MKKQALTILIITVLFFTAGCSKREKKMYVPKAKNDKIFTVVGGDNEEKGYTISVPSENYRYEKEYDDGNLEEKWEYTKKDDIGIKVLTYKNTDELTARGKFLKDNDDYIFEDLMGYSLCGMEPDGDTLWFNLYEEKENVYIVSWEYPKDTKEELKKELADIAGTFKLKK